VRVSIPTARVTIVDDDHGYYLVKHPCKHPHSMHSMHSIHLPGLIFSCGCQPSLGTPRAWWRWPPLRIRLPNTWWQRVRCAYSQLFSLVRTHSFLLLRNLAFLRFSSSLTHYYPYVHSFEFPRELSHILMHTLMTIAMCHTGT
jgi:hypothetical protein